MSNRIKHLRIADQSPNGWETVAHYERKDIAIDDQDDKKMRKAEHDAQEASNLRHNSRRGRGMFRGRFRPPFQPYDSSSRQMYPAMGPFRGGNQWNQGVALPDNRRRARPSDTCFFCGKLGHWQVDCPEKANRKCECYDEAVYDNSDIYYFDYLEHSENGYVSPENVFAYCHTNACQIRSASDHFNEVMTSNYRCNARCAFCDNVNEYCECLVKGMRNDDIQYLQSDTNDIVFADQPRTVRMATKSSEDFLLRKNDMKPVLKPISMLSDNHIVLWNATYQEYERTDCNISVVGRLKRGRHFMQSIGCSEYILRVITNGYVLPLTSLPASKILKNNRSSLKHPQFVRASIDDLLASGAIFETKTKPFVINPLTVSDKNNKLRLVLDLRHINKFIVLGRFRFEGAETFLKYVKPGNWIFSFDLKSGYHHIPMLPAHYKYLGFAYPDIHGCIRYFCFRVLPFGLSSAGFIFTKVL